MESQNQDLLNGLQDKVGALKSVCCIYSLINIMNICICTYIVEHLYTF